MVESCASVESEIFSREPSFLGCGESGFGRCGGWLLDALETVTQSILMLDVTDMYIWLFDFCMLMVTLLFPGRSSWLSMCTFSPVA